MSAATERLGNRTDVIVAVAAERTLGDETFFAEGPAQAEGTTLYGKFMTDVRLKVRWAVGGEAGSINVKFRFPMLVGLIPRRVLIFDMD